MGKFCPRYSMILFSNDSEKNARLLARSSCKAWTCLHCAKQNTRNVRKKNIIAISARETWAWYFATLTARGGKRTPEGTFNALKSALPSILKELRNEIKRTQAPTPPRAYKKSKIGQSRGLVWRGLGLFGLEYFAIYERHKDGNFHLHLLVGLECDIEIERERKKKSKKEDFDLYLEGLAVRYGLGFKTHASRLASGDKRQVIAYVTKSTRYLMKDSQFTIRALPKKARLIQQSRAFSSVALSGSDKQWTQGHRLMENDLKDHWIDINLKLSVTFDMLDGGVYPPVSENIEDHDDKAPHIEDDSYEMF